MGHPRALRLALRASVAAWATCHATVSGTPHTAEATAFVLGARGLSALDGCRAHVKPVGNVI
jgi:hypothetical protein